MACPATPAGGEGQTISKKQSKKGPGEDRNEEGEQTAQNPSLGAMGTMETEEDPFHGTLVGALQEHHGMPMTCNWHAKPPSSYNDGCGLCSPGRWPPSRRNFQDGEAKVFIDRLAGLVRDFTHQVIPNTQKAFFALALGKLQDAPFTEGQMQGLRKQWFQMLPSPGQAAVIPEGQPFYLHAIAQRARAMGEEDADVLDKGPDNYCDGRLVGYGHVFPRVPLVFRPKLKHRQYDDSEYRAENENYSSAKEHSQQIEVQFQEEERLGFMFPLSEGEAKRRYGDKLRVASLGAIPKDDERVRVIFDATHFVQINNGISIQDRLEFPGPESSATVMEETWNAGHRLMVAVAADIALAHRRFKHRAEDVGPLGCRVEPDGPIWFNKVGTFGVACAAYHFGRLASLLGRLVLRLAGQAHVFQLLFADDLKLVAAGEDKYDRIWYMLVAWLMLDTPFRWPKFRGGVCLEFVGFYMDYCKFELGLSEKRTNWIVQWVEEARRNGGLVTHRSFIELVGRLVYASQVLVWLKPLMAPLHAWKSTISAGTAALLPQSVSVILLFVADMLKSGFNRTSGRSPLRGRGQVFRTDAKCEKDRIVLGGWELGEHSDPMQARWFALEVRESDAPWLFETSHLPSRSTVSELLATLLALEVFGFLKGRSNPQKIELEAGTDNLATEHIVRKGASNKFPLAYVQMQLGLKCFWNGLVFKLKWRPREVNVEADDLTNFRFDRFSLDRRCRISWRDFDWSMMEKLLSFRGEVQEWREERKRKPPDQAKLTKRQKMATKTKW